MEKLFADAHGNGGQLLLAPTLLGLDRARGALSGCNISRFYQAIFIAWELPFPVLFQKFGQKVGVQATYHVTELSR